MHGASLVQQRVFIVENERSPAVQKLESKRLEKAVGVVDRHLANGREHLLASGFCAADTNVGYSVSMGRSFIDLEPFPHARAYLERMEARPAFQAALANRQLARTKREDEDDQAASMTSTS